MKITHLLLILCVATTITLESCESSDHDSENQDPGSTTVEANSDVVASPSDVVLKEEESDADRFSDTKSASIKKQICSEYGFAWESINQEADIYTVILFNDSEFKIGAYTMNGSNNPKKFTRQFDFPGDWVMINENKVEGTFYETGKKVEWSFNQDYSSLTNNNGVEFIKVKINN